MTISLIGLDADDTLWHSEDGFHTVTGRFCELLQPYAQDPSNLATTLDMVERRNMALFGYGVKSFTLSMVEAAIEVSGGAVPAETIQQLVDEGRTLLARPVDLLEGVEEALAAIAARYRLVVITKGDLLHQEQKFHASGLDRHVEEIAVVSEKDVRTYRRLVERYGVEPGGFLMVGNSIRSDILPVLELGGRAVHIPYEYLWGHEVAEHDGGVPTLASIKELPGWLASDG
jgi:putative hydrolase of the HAD superfamily